MASLSEREDAHEHGRSRSREKHFPSVQKTAAVLRVLGGESVESVSEDLGVSIRRLERWQSEFVSAGAAALARRKDLPHEGWFAKHRKSVAQWTWLLIFLVLVIGGLAAFLVPHILSEK